MQAYIWIYGWIFNKEGPLILLFLVCCVFPHYEEPRQPYYGLYYGVMYFSQGMTTYVISVVIKKTVNRMRPVCNRSLHRVHDLRGIVDCASWPSGDAMQAAVFTTFMLVNMHRFVEAIGIRWFMMTVPF
jgi:hypothetical protein